MLGGCIVSGWQPKETVSLQFIWGRGVNGGLRVGAIQQVEKGQGLLCEDNPRGPRLAEMVQPRGV